MWPLWFWLPQSKNSSHAPAPTTGRPSPFLDAFAVSNLGTWTGGALLITSQRLWQSLPQVFLETSYQQRCLNCWNEHFSKFSSSDDAALGATATILTRGNCGSLDWTEVGLQSLQCCRRRRRRAADASHLTAAAAADGMCVSHGTVPLS